VLRLLAIPPCFRFENACFESLNSISRRSLDQKRALIKDITDAVVKNFSVPAEAVMVEIVESEPTAKAKGGVLFSEMRR